MMRIIKLHAWRTQNRRRAKTMRRGWDEGRGKSESREVEEDCRRLWVVGEREFLACSLDMGQEINGTSNTDANSVNRAAQRPTSIMSRGCTALSMHSNRYKILSDNRQPSNLYHWIRCRQKLPINLSLRVDDKPRDSFLISAIRRNLRKEQTAIQISH